MYTIITSHIHNTTGLFTLHMHKDGNMHTFIKYINYLPSKLSSSTTAAVIIGYKDDNNVAYGLRFGDLIISPHNIPYVFCSQIMYPG